MIKMIRPKKTSPKTLIANYWVFSTELGWMVAVGQNGVLNFLSIGHPSEIAARKAIANDVTMDVALDAEEKNWCSQLVRRLQAFAKRPSHGDQNVNHPLVDFQDVLIDDETWTPFQRKVLQACRKIAPGKTLTYAEMAEKVGSPGAARAVGNCMARNRFPLIIPCHRVVGSNGHLGGYSAAEGIPFKKRLLELEAAAKMLK